MNGLTDTRGPLANLPDLLSTRGLPPLSGRASLPLSRQITEEEQYRSEIMSSEFN